jgi:MFS family permease
MAAGLAFMIGPLASSKLLTTYEQAATFAGACLLIAALLIALLPTLPDESTEKDENDNESESPTRIADPTKWWSKLIPDFVPAARTPPALFIMSARTCMVLAFHIFQTIWAVALKERFNFGPKEYGQYFGFIGFAYAISQGFLAKFLIQKFASTNMGRARLLLLCSLTLGGGRLFAYRTHNIVAVYVIFCGIITALGIVNTIFTADTSKIASPQELGGLFGVLSSVESLAGIVGPMIGGALSKIHPQHGPLMAVLALYAIVFTQVSWGYERYVGVHSVTSDKKTT